MNKVLKSIGSAVGTGLDVLAEMGRVQREIDEIAQTLVTKSRGKLSIENAKIAAEVLYYQAEPIEWK